MRMKKMMALVIAIAMMLCCTLSVSAASVEFTDIEGHWAEESILRWTATGIINGYKAADGTYEFKPNESIKRGEFAKIMSTVLGLTAEAENTFEDLPDGKWYTTYILRCAAAGIMQGDTQGYVNPEQNITREQAFAMYTRTLEMDAGTKGDLSGFEDSDKVAGWAAGSVAAMYNYNAVQGHKGGDLDPKGDLTRAQAVMILDRLIGVYVDAEGNVSTSSADAEGMVCNFVVVNAQCQEDVKVEASVDAEGKTEITVTVKEEAVTVKPDNDKLPAVVVQDAIVSVDPEKDEPVNVQGATEKENAVISTHSHTWDEGEVTKEPDCTNKGIVTYSCACGETKTEEIAVVPEAHIFENGACVVCKKAHDCKASYGEILKTPTCLEGGSYQQKCSCGKSLVVVELPADTETGHSYTLVADDGSHTCALCNGTISGHQFENWKTTKEADCDTLGERICTCDCGAVHEEKISMPYVHHWDNGVCTECHMKVEDCTHECVTYYTSGESGEYCNKACQVCGSLLNQSEHQDIIEYDSWYHYYTCKLCSRSDSGEHELTNGVCTGCGYKCEHEDHGETITKPATCVEEGEKTLTCQCGYTWTEPVDVDVWGGHDYQIQGELHVCTLCGKESTGHSYDTVSQTQDPDCDSLGERTYTCDCGYSHTEVIPYKHEWDEEDVCSECSMTKSACKHEYSNRFSSGSNGEICLKYCPVCYLEEQGDHEPVPGYCDQSRHNFECKNCESWIEGGEHRWNENSKCDVCEYACLHGYYNDGLCGYCGASCSHDWVQNTYSGYCQRCNLYCNHESFDANGQCELCKAQAEAMDTDKKEYYYSAYQALDNSEVKNVKLLKDVEIESYISFSGKSIDLNRHSLSVYSMQIFGTCSITNGTLNCYPGKGGTSWAIVVNGSSHNLTVENVTVNAYMDPDVADEDNPLTVFSAQGGYFTITGCTINVTDATGNALGEGINVYAYKKSSDYENAVTMTDCKLSGCIEPA